MLLGYLGIDFLDMAFRMYFGTLNMKQNSGDFYITSCTSFLKNIFIHLFNLVG